MIGSQVSIRVRQAYFDILTKQEIGFHEIETSSKINARLTTECFAIQEALGTKFALSCRGSVVLSCCEKSLEIS